MEFITSLLIADNSLTPFAYALTTVGALFLLGQALSFSKVLLDTLILPGESLSKYGAKKGSWAVITGGTQGIGLAFARQLARSGFNIVLVSRSISKLNEVADEINDKYSVETKIIDVDFATATETDYTNIKAILEPLPISVLVNNVGISYEYPKYFYELSETEIQSFVNINVVAQLRLTHFILPGMVSRKRGLIFNMGSFSAFIPTALLSVYAGTKGFLQIWSQALGEELQDSGVRVQYINAGFVTSALSKIRKPKWDVPTPDRFVHSVLSSIGRSGGAQGYPFSSNPFWAHALLQWVPEHFGTWSFWMWISKSMQLSVRQRALKKRQREAPKKLE